MTILFRKTAVKVHHLSGTNRGKTQYFEGPRKITIGRRVGSDVSLDLNNDLTVSADHAVIEINGKNVFFMDFGSSNGSWISGRRIERIKLAGGEEVELGSGGPTLKIELVKPGARDAALGPTTQPVAPLNRSAQEPRPVRTSYIRALAKEAARRGSRRFKIVMGIIILVLAGVVAFLIVELRQAREEIREIGIAKMGPSEIGEWIADANRGTIYLLIYRTELGFEQGFCTGFAVSEHKLMTNAHCVVQIDKFAKESSEFFAAPNEGLGTRYRISKWRAHPEYNPDSAWPTPDVGVVTVDGRLPSSVPMATREHLAHLRPGAQIFVFGFPGDLSDVRSPVATITEGVVGRLTALDGQAAEPGERRLLQYSAFTSKGTSGSPVFNNQGRVIAVNSGYYQGRSRVTIEDPETGKSEEADVSRDLSGYSFGIRIDLAGSLLN